MEEIGKSLKILYKTVSNFAEGETLILLTLKNEGTQEIPGIGFSCYFCHDNFLFPEIYDARRGVYNIRPFNSQLLLPRNLKLDFIKGCMYKLTPLLGPPLQPNETAQIELFSRRFSVSKYDSFPNWYCTNETNHVVVVQSTEDMSYVQDFDSRFNHFRLPNDIRSVPLEPQDRFVNDTFETGTTMDECMYRIVPTPRKSFFDPPNFKTLSIAANWKITYNTESARYLAERLAGKCYSNSLRL